MFLCNLKYCKHIFLLHISEYAPWWVGTRLKVRNPYINGFWTLTSGEPSFHLWLRLLAPHSKRGSHPHQVGPKQGFKGEGTQIWTGKMAKKGIKGLIQCKDIFPVAIRDLHWNRGSFIHVIHIYGAFIFHNVSKNLAYASNY